MSTNEMLILFLTSLQLVIWNIFVKVIHEEVEVMSSMFQTPDVTQFSVKHAKAKVR